MRTTVRRSGLWAVYRWVGKSRRRRVRLFAGCASRCFRWVEQKANAIERKTNLRPFLYVTATKRLFYRFTHENGEPINQYSTKRKVWERGWPKAAAEGRLFPA